jgi:hypothetical protein
MDGMCKANKNLNILKRAEVGGGLHQEVEEHAEEDAHEEEPVQIVVAVVGEEKWKVGVQELSEEGQLEDEEEHGQQKGRLDFVVHLVQGRR